MTSTTSTSSDSGDAVLIEGDQDTGVGLASAQYSGSRRSMLDLINRLQNTGVQADIDLPQIAVIGSQSAGKSSLIESISGITLPRSQGTCTRCPTECKLAYADEPWKCIVSLRFITDKTGVPLGEARNVLFGPPITRRADVEERVRRAQRAVLNPSSAERNYLTLDDDELPQNELAFSKNCVSLKITGKDVADLSFCDLPGLTATADSELIESLACSYIEKPSCIILLAVTCESDFETQGAYRLVKLKDPEGKRTIGVLTKPDRIPPTEEDRWLRLIRNEAEPLDNNWYCVKQPDSASLKRGISWADARREENEFFGMTAPWSALGLTHQRLLRTSNLTDRLSAILSDLITKRLPEIQDEIQGMLRTTEAALSELPRRPADDAFTEIMGLIQSFTQDLSRHVLGVPDKDGLMQAIRPAQMQFRRAIRGTAPDFRPYERAVAEERSLEAATFLENEEGSEERREGDEIYIDEVLERARDACTRELPGNYPFVVKQWYITNIVKQWERPADQLCEAIHKKLVDHVKKVVTIHFASVGQGQLEQRVKVVMADHVKTCLKATREKVRWLLSLETLAFTLNEHYLSDYKTKFLSYYRGSRSSANNSALLQTIKAYTPTPTTDIYGRVIATATPTGVAKALAGLAEIGLNIKPDDLPKLLPPDPMDPALEVMAEVRAYFQVAYKRFADIVPLAIDVELVRGLEAGFVRALHTGLGITGAAGARVCAELIQESPNIASRREELEKKLDRLNGGSQELLHFG